ncbi:hypothetical protein PG993_015064 [Apiospora rasikravindrae]|uniref:Ankyrin repeat protein n=1 Tax=Apiospora rasikravindrae TaxID=990691 RepID=A0ABR1RPI7_9PEZI
MAGVISALYEIANESTVGQTCLSTDSHELSIRNYTLHYFGCLKYAERARFFDPANPRWSLYSVMRDLSSANQGEEIQGPDAYRESWETLCHAKLESVARLRNMLAEDPEERHLVECLTASRASCLAHLREDARNRGFDPFTSSDVPENANPPSDRPTPVEAFVEASLMYFQETDTGFRGADVKPDAIPGVFPNQYTRLDNLLSPSVDWFLPAFPPPESPGYGKGMKYFHLPYNNIEAEMPYLHREAYSQRQRYERVVEKAIRDFEEEEERKRKREQERRISRTDQSRPSRSSSSLAHESSGRSSTSSRKTDTPQPASTPSSGESRLATFLYRLDRPRPSLPMDPKGRVSVQSPLGQYLLDAARLFQGMAEYGDKAVIQKYLMSSKPLHPRRTLGQSYHWTLKDGEDDSQKQVLYRASKPRAFPLHHPGSGTWPEHAFALTGDCEKCREDSHKFASIVMVDQLWMWILDSQTIITCFPDQYGSNRLESSGVDKSIRARIQSPNSRLGSVFELGLVIIDECSVALFGGTKATDGQTELVNVFSAKIGRIRNRQQFLFKQFWQWATKIERKIQAEGNSADIKVPLDLFTEGMLIRELKDMIEELDIMIHTMRTQQNVLRAYIANAERILDPLNDFRSNTQRIYVSRQRKRNPLSGALKEIDNDNKEETQRAVQEDRFYRFRSHADECSAKLHARVESLEGLRKAANVGVDSVKDLLELKGQQASLIQAWRSTAQTEETVYQGRVILVFTLVTIVFLPLSFMSSIFGMNNAEFGSGDLLIHDEIVYMVAVSMSVIVISLGLAFNAWLRALFWYVYKVVTARFLVSTGLYGLWLRFSVPAETLEARGNRTANDLFRDAAPAVRDEHRAYQPLTPPPTDAAVTPLGRVARRLRRQRSGAPDPENGESVGN